MSKIDNYLAVHANSIRLRSTRAELLAGNLINADTPGYRAQDIDFASALNAANAQSRNHARTTHTMHIPVGTAAAESRVVYRDSPHKSLDENSVDSSQERTLFADNEIRYRASVQFLTNRVNSLIRTLRGE